MFDKEIVLTYKGPFDKKLLSVLGNYIKTTIGDNINDSNRIFEIFIELAQNIAFNSVETSRLYGHSSLGIMVICEGKDCYLCIRAMRLNQMKLFRLSINAKFKKYSRNSLHSKRLSEEWRKPYYQLVF